MSETFTKREIEEMTLEEMAEKGLSYKAPHYLYGVDVMSIEEAKKTYPLKSAAEVMRDQEDNNHRISAISALGQTCKRLYVSNDGYNSRFAFEIATLDYGPVLDVFLEHGVQRVTYGAEDDLFLFRFATRDEAVAFSRRFHNWFRVDGLTLSRAEKLKGDYSISVSAIRKVSAAATSTQDRCTACSNTFIHPAYNRPLEYCPNCGASFLQFASNKPLAGGTTPYPLAPTATSHLPPISMRCPGGCGSELKNVLPASTQPGAANPFDTLCPYHCKVRVEVWNKKLEEAKKK